MSNSYKRQRLFVDSPIQGALLLRIAGYWAVTLMTQVLMVLFFAVISAAPNDFYSSAQHLWWHLELVLLASTLVLPMLLIDVVRLSHRWVGPVFRLRGALQALSRNEKVNPIRFRAGDFWQELAGDFNVIAEELQRRRGEQTSQTLTEHLPQEAGSATAN